jgi:hypothetical protein
MVFVIRGNANRRLPIAFAAVVSEALPHNYFPHDDSALQEQSPWPRLNVLLVCTYMIGIWRSYRAIRYWCRLSFFSQRFSFGRPQFDEPA